MRSIPYGAEPNVDYGWGGPILWALFELPIFVVNLAMSLAYWLASSALAQVRGTVSAVRFVEAVTVSFYPQESRTWTTSADRVESVIDEIVTAMKEGKEVRPLGATFRGTREV